MAKKKAQHGGKRPGAGRKINPEGPSVVIAASVPKALVAELDAYTELTGWNRSRAVTEAIRRLVARKKR